MPSFDPDVLIYALNVQVIDNSHGVKNIYVYIYMIERDIIFVSEIIVWHSEIRLHFFPAHYGVLYQNYFSASFFLHDSREHGDTVRSN